MTRVITLQFPPGQQFAWNFTNCSPLIIVTHFVIAVAGPKEIDPKARLLEHKNRSAAGPQDDVFHDFILIAAIVSVSA